MIQNMLQLKLIGRMHLFGNAIILLFAFANINSAMNNSLYNVHISFDQAFHNSWFKKTMDACMSSWGTIREEMQDGLLAYERDLLAQVILGKLAYAQFCVTNLSKDIANIDRRQQNRVRQNLVSRQKITSDSDLCKNVAVANLAVGNALASMKLHDGEERDASGEYNAGIADTDTGESIAAPADMAHLMRVVEGMRVECSHLEHYFNSDYALCVQDIFSNLTGQLNNMIEHLKRISFP